MRGPACAALGPACREIDINPLVVTGSGDLMALDAKMSFDTNALFRRPQVAALRDPAQEDAREAMAADNGLAYVGCNRVNLVSERRKDEPVIVAAKVGRQRGGARP